MIVDFNLSACVISEVSENFRYNLALTIENNSWIFVSHTPYFMLKLYLLNFLKHFSL
jgi:hypothetical protein